MMGAASFLKSQGLTTVCGRTYPGTFSLVRRSNFFADQVDNRDSASWKKAEHIVVEELQSDEGRSILPRWRMLTAKEPVGLSIQKHYVAIGGGRYARYDAEGHGPKIGTLQELFS